MFPVQFPQLQLLSDHFLHTKHSQAPITSWLPYTGQERSQVRVWANLLFLRIKISAFCLLIPVVVKRGFFFSFPWSQAWENGYLRNLYQSFGSEWGQVDWWNSSFSAHVRNVVFSRTSSNHLEPEYHEAVQQIVHFIGRKKNWKACHCILKLSLMLP